MTKKIKLLLYVADVEASSLFWQKIGFKELQREEADGTLVIVLETENFLQLVLYDRIFTEQYTKEPAPNAPAMMFEADNPIEWYRELEDKGVELGDLMQVGKELVFNFIDLDGNYFAVSGPEE